MSSIHSKWKWLIGVGMIALTTGTLFYRFQILSARQANVASDELLLDDAIQAPIMLADYSHLSQAGLVSEHFLEALRINDQATVETYLQRGLDPNMPFCDLYLEGIEPTSDTPGDCSNTTTLLHHLVTFPNIIDPAMLDVLIAHGADVNLQNENGETLLHTLAVQLPIPNARIGEVGQQLILNGADINARDRGGQTILEAALCAETPSNSLVAHLVDHNVDLAALMPQSICNTTLLHLAARVNHPELAEFSLAQGIDVNAKDDDGRIPLHDLRGSAAGEVLLASGADINAQNADGQTPLESAICLHSDWTPLKADVIAWLLDNGARSQPLPLDVGCGPLLTQAIGSDSAALAEVAIANGSDITARDQEGQTALHQTSRFNSPKVAALLLAKGMDINAVDDDGYTPLHIAAIHRNFDVAQLLIEQGADINAVDADGHTPLYEAQNLAWESHQQDSSPALRQALIDLLKQSGGEV